MYKCKYYKIQEIVPKDMLTTIPEDLLWEIFDPNVLKFADVLRNKYGLMTINTDGMQDCGVRDMDDPSFLKYDPHKYFRALDLHNKALDDKYLVHAERVKAYNNWRHAIHMDLPLEEKQMNINYEIDISWLHIDTYNRPRPEFKG
jgi:hypothetical protein